ncbi:MAG: PAS domain S-box protein, partial [Candidatus Odinarchaeota archaeon]
KESEEKYRLISENTDDLIIVYDENGVVEYINAETHSRILGYKPRKFYDKFFRDTLVHKDDKELADKSGNEGLEKGNFEYQFRLKHENGNYLWFEVTGKRFQDTFGNRKILCVSRNINEEKLAEQKIKESEENFRTIAEQAFMGILIIQDDKVGYLNNALLQIFEYSHEEVENLRKDDLVKLIYPEDLQYLRDYREKLRAGESDIKPYYSYRVFTKYGKLKWIDQFSRPIIYRGKLAELITIMDITEKKKAEQELIKLNSLKSELLRRTSHELKTPLVSIKGFSDLLLTVHREKLDDYVLATIHEIKLGCERLENLIQDILKTAELESESVELKKVEEDLSFLIKLCVRELQGLTRLRNHEIKLNIHDKLVTKFEPDQIHLVLSNLLNNAIKYTPPNGKIEIKSIITDDYILISLEDNGIGLTNDEKKRLFTQFGKIERYGQGLDIISEGSGLGLYITKKIIELHGGTLRVKSKGRNKGSTFYFTLPVIK